MPAGSDPPTPDGARTLDELAARLRMLRLWAGVSYRDVHRKVVRARHDAGIVEVPVYNTVYRSLQPGRSRLDVELLVDIARVLLEDDRRAIAWRQAYQAITGRIDRAALVTLLDRIPDDLPTFTGRHSELGQALEEGASVTAITGMPGVGKTTLALHAAHRRLLHAKPLDIQWYVNLRGFDPDLPPADPAAVLEAFLRALGCHPEQSGQLDLARRIAEYHKLVSACRGVIVLDNAASAEQVRPLLPDGSSCFTLLTSRRALTDLAEARHLPLDVFPTGDAIALLRRSAGERWASADAAAAARIADLVGLLPLALDLVAGQIADRGGDWTLADHCERLAQRRRGLRLDDGIEVALGLSYESLPADQQRTFRLLTLHPGRVFDIYTAAALTGADLDVAEHHLAELTSSNLLRRKASGQYEFHDLIHIYAAAQSQDHDPASARDAAVTRLLDYYQYVAALAMDQYAAYEKHRRPQIPDPGTPVPELTDLHTATRWLDTERTNLVAAAVHASHRGRHEQASHLSTLLFRYLDIGAHHRDAEILHGCAASTPDRAGRAQALTNLANGWFRTGRHAEAIDQLQQALALYRESSDVSGEGRALGQLGNIHERLGRYNEAIDYFRGALACSERAGDRRSAGVSYNNIGAVHERCGEFSDALRHYQRAADMMRELGDRRGEGRIFSNMGTLSSSLGRHTDALGYLGQALDIACEIGDRRGQATVHNDLGNVLRKLGQPSDALDHYQLASGIADEFDEVYEQARAAEGTANAHADLGDVRTAGHHWQRALELHNRLDTPEAKAIAAQLHKLGISVVPARDGEQPRQRNKIKK